MDEPDKSYLDKLKTHKENAFKIVNYSMQRIDLLLISISGAGIYVCGEIFKFMVSDKVCICHIYTFPIKISGLLFVIAIVINFLGQWASYKANMYDIFLTDTKIYEKENEEKLNDVEKTENFNSKKIYYSKKASYDKLTNLSNNISIFSMVIGMLILLIIIFITF